MTPGILFNLIVLFIIFEFILSRILDWLNLKYWKEDLPEDAEGIYDQEKYKQAQKYNKEVSKFGLITASFGLILILLMLFFDGFAYLDQWIRTSNTEHHVWLPLLFFGILFIAQDILTLPFSLYSTFVIEEKYGFNNTRIGTFITDKLKAYLLTFLIGGALLAGLAFFYSISGSNFWWIGWVIVSSFSIFMAMFYTSLFVPIFNKLSPLEEGSLLSSIRSYASNVNFPLKEIWVMDSSKRSSKANAFFSGIGPRKSIVLFDTLIKDHSEEEITAVLAHEVGHFKKKHVLQGIALSIFQMGLLFFLFGWLSGYPKLAEVLGAEKNSFHLAIIAFSLLYSPVSMLTGIFMNMYSRKNEYEADSFAKTTYDSQYLISALKKLSSNNLSNLTPHPAYVFFHYSHPPLLKRIRALKSV
ncbi:MAG: M48 family metallopeptidase [Chitinophagales bacterium]|nr:M48 family metallopeptidase [Chitinophagales bacterium]